MSISKPCPPEPAPPNNPQGSVSLNGVNVVIDSYFSSANLAASNTLRLQLVDANALANTMLVVPDTGDYKRFFAPKEPTGVQVSVAAGVLNVSFNSNGETGTVFNIYRNGTLVAQNLSSTSWNDLNAANYASKTLCYSVEQKYTGSFPVENLSHHSEPVCYWVAGSITRFSTVAGLFRSRIFIICRI